MPTKYLTELHLGGKNKEQPLRNIKNGKATSTSLYGYYRRLSESSAYIFEDLMKDFLN